MNYVTLNNELAKTGTKLVAVSKTHPQPIIQDLYTYGQRDFGENKVQELLEKVDTLPQDIRWHMIGHLQRNKVKYIIPFIHMIHSIDSFRLLREVNKEAAKINRKIKCLLQVKIAQEESKFGFSPAEVKAYLRSEEFQSLKHIEISGLMGMATYTTNTHQIRSEFRTLKQLFDELETGIFAGQPGFEELSMGMSGDYELAIEEGSTMVRIGSLIFGKRTAYVHS